jgi:hypothetical protein
MHAAECQGHVEPSGKIDHKADILEVKDKLSFIKIHQLDKFYPPS